MTDMIEKLAEEYQKITWSNRDGTLHPLAPELSDQINWFSQALAASGLSLIETDELERLRDDGWHDISTAPKDGTPFMAYYPAFDALSNEAQVETWYDCGEWHNNYVCGADSDRDAPTHWQPLPTPPRKGE